MRIETWMTVALSAACSCGAEPDATPPAAQDPAGGAACFVLDAATYNVAADVCAEQAPGTVAAACVGAPPSEKQCAPFRVLYRAQGEERYYCCCDPSLSTGCDFAAP